jgi:nucleotide-binding universal stress UspA family protein
VAEHDPTLGDACTGGHAMSASPKPFTVLVPLDGSELAEAVLDLAAVIARRMAGRLVLLTVPQVYGLDVAWYTAGAPDAAALVPMDDLLHQARAASEAYLAAVAERLGADGLTVTTLLADEDPPVAIVGGARDAGADLIAMVTHGRGGLDRWAFGSVADKVLQTADKPVLLARAANGRVRDDIGLIAVAVDGSPLAEAVLAPVADLARAFGARIMLVHVTPEAAAAADPATMSASESSYQARAGAYLADLVQRLRSDGGAAEALLLAGQDAAELILERADNRDVDVLAFTTHGRTGLQRLAFGSVADRLIRHAAKPVLVVRNRAE